MWHQLSRTIYAKPWWEITFLYTIMLVLTVGLGWAQTVIAWLGGFVLFIVALAFMYLPTEWLRYHGEDQRAYGIATGSISYSWKKAVYISLIVLIPYTFAYHYWQVFQGRSVDYNTAALSKWPESLEGVPSVRTIDPGEVRWYTQRDRIYWHWKLKKNEKSIKIQMKVDANSQWQWVGRSRGIKIQEQERTSLATRTFIIKGNKSGYLIAKSNTNTMKLKAWIDRQKLSSDRLLLGPFMQQQAQWDFQRTYIWILYLLLTQLFLVAIPEEVFYRGYMQTRLDQLVGKDQIWWGAAFNFKSALLCSLFFAVAHFATIPHGTRFAVFFPSLLFGWMRRAYGNTLTPAIFHALCNVWIHLLWGFYQGSVS